MINFRQAMANDVDRCYEIETSAYEGDEAATYEKIDRRVRDYPQGFLLLEENGHVVGFINSGCAHQVVMSDEAFKELIGHDPGAPNVVIMSVVVDPAHQGKGYSKLLMQAFIKQMVDLGKSSISLMCKEHHLPLYRRFGYSYLRPSVSEHGGMSWHEMTMLLK